MIRLLTILLILLNVPAEAKDESQALTFKNINIIGTAGEIVEKLRNIYGEDNCYYNFGELSCTDVEKSKGQPYEKKARIKFYDSNEVSYVTDTYIIFTCGNFDGCEYSPKEIKDKYSQKYSYLEWEYSNSIKLVAETYFGQVYCAVGKLKDMICIMDADFYDYEKLPRVVLLKHQLDAKPLDF